MRRLGEEFQRRVEHAVLEGRGVRPEVRRLHRAGAAAGRDGQAVAGQPAAEPGRAGVRRGAALQGMAAHDAHHPGTGEVLVQGIGHGVVVDAPQHRGEDVAVRLGLLEPVVRAGVRGGVIAGVGQPLEEFVRAVEAAPVGVERQARYGREDEGAPGSYLGGGVRFHGAAEEHGARGVRAEQRERTVRQIDRLDAVSGEAARGDDPVELRQGFDLVVAVVVVGAGAAGR